MNRFKVTYFFAILAALLFCVSGIVLVINYAMISIGLVNELKQASNFDRWHVAMILAGIFAVAFAILNAYFAYLFAILKKGRKDKIVGELIYILGIVAEGEKTSVRRSDRISVTSADEISIFGLGHDDDNHWTFSGRIPTNEPK